MKKIFLVFLLFNFSSLIFSKVHIYKYKIKKEDTLLEICDAFKVNKNELYKYNHQRKIDRLWVGDTLKIPLKKVKIIKYKVKRGDTIFDLIEKYKADVHSIYTINKEKVIKRMWVGDIILIPTSLKLPFHKKRTKIKNKKINKFQNYIFYKVKPGDTYYKISRKFQIKVNLLQNINKQNLYAGDTIKIPKNIPIVIKEQSSLALKKTYLDLKIPGLRYKALRKTIIKAPISGHIIGIRSLKGFGKAIFIKNGNITSILASKGFQNINVSIGNKINKENSLAYVHKNYHLYYFVLKGSRFIEPKRNILLY